MKKKKNKISKDSKAKLLFFLILVIFSLFLIDNSDAGSFNSNSTVVGDYDIDHWTSTQLSAGDVSSGSLSDTYTSNNGYYALVETKATSGGSINDRNYLLAWRFDFTGLETTRIDTKLYIEANTTGENFRTFWGPDTSTHNAISSCDVSATSDSFYVCDIPNDASSSIYIFFLDNEDVLADASDTTIADILGIDQIVLELTIPVPNLDFITPNLDDNSYSNTQTIQFNITANENLDIALLETENSNTSMDKFNTTSAGIEYTYGSDGIETYRIFANNTAGYGNYTEMRSINIDLTYPDEIDFISPTPDSTILYSEAKIAVTFTETNPYNCIFQFNNGTSINYTNSSIGSDTCTFNLTTEDDIVSIIVFVNDSAGNMNNTYKRNFTVDATFLNATLITPTTEMNTNVVQNSTFIVNATVYCIGGSCGDVRGTIQYNSSVVPDTPINITSGGTPFFINESSALATKNCPNNPLQENDFCNISWIINATWDPGKNWLIGVLFNSTSSEIAVDNYTSNATVEIVPCLVDITSFFSSIQFGEIPPNSDENPAEDNDNYEYNLSVNADSCNVDFYIKSTNLRNETLDTEIDINNMTFSNTTNEYSSSYNMTRTFTIVKLDVAETENATIYFWLNSPPIYAGSYNGTITVSGVENGDLPP